MARRMHITGLAASLAAVCAAYTPPGDPHPEDQLRAATVLAILQHSAWPKEPAPAPRLTIGVLGRSGMAEALRRTVEGKSVNGRTVRVAEGAALAEPQCCDAFYLASDRKLEIQRVMPAAGGRVLTIGEGDRFLDNGGAIRLFVEDGHMAFEADLGVLKRAGITISSRLLRFGKLRGGRREEAQ